MYAKEFYEYFKTEFIYLKKEDEILPEPITCEQPYTMENDTILRRIPEDIIEPVIKAEKTFFPKSERTAKLKRIQDLLKNGSKSTYEKFECQNTDEDAQYWTFLLNHFISKNMPIINNPFLFTEIYFYRYLNVIYMSKGRQVDPFGELKNLAIVKNIATIEEICSCANTLQESFNKKQPDKMIFSIFFFLSLWANQYDLSWKLSANKGQEKTNGQNETTETKGTPDVSKKSIKTKHFDFQTEDICALYNSFHNDYVLCNDIEEIFELVTRQEKKYDRLDMVLDNAGVELIADLCLLKFLSIFFEKIVIHVKKNFFYVSDVIIIDFMEAIDCLAQNKKQPNSYKLGLECKEFLSTGKWVLMEDIYWNLPLPYWILSIKIFNELKKSNLICIKGDFNYRRCLGDLKYDFSTCHKRVLNYFPAPVVLLRCLKSPLGCGIDKKIVDMLNSEKGGWSNYGE